LYRSELTGLYSILAILHEVCLYFEVPEGNVQIGCDGLSALQNSFEKGPSLSTDFPDYDLLGAIYHLRKISKVTWTQNMSRDTKMLTQKTWIIGYVLMLRWMSTQNDFSHRRLSLLVTMISKGNRGSSGSMALKFPKGSKNNFMRLCIQLSVRSIGLPNQIAPQNLSGLSTGELLGLQ
jgi:hypothetical protein